MHVVLYVYGYIPTAGGCYTFQREILKAVINLAGQSKHHFSVLTHDSKNLPVHEIALGTLNVIPIESPVTEIPPRRGILQKFKRVEKPSPDLNILSPLDFTARKNDIEFIWFVTPAYEVIDMPYIAPVW